jgi:hypothetical protein
MPQGLVRGYSFMTPDGPARVEPQPKRAIVFFDGQNLFYAAREAFGYTHPNYDAQAQRWAGRKYTAHAWRPWWFSFLAVSYLRGYPVRPLLLAHLAPLAVQFRLSANRRGINKTDWVRITRQVYDACLDRRNYHFGETAGT